MRGEHRQQVETRPSFLGHLAAENGLELPWHEESAAQQIGSGIGSAEFDEPREFRFPDRHSIDNLAECATGAGDARREPHCGYDGRNPSERRIASEELVPTEPGERDLQPRLR